MNVCEYSQKGHNPPPCLSLHLWKMQEIKAVPHGLVRRTQCPRNTQDSVWHPVSISEHFVCHLHFLPPAPPPHTPLLCFAHPFLLIFSCCFFTPSLSVSRGNHWIAWAPTSATGKCLGLAVWQLRRSAEMPLNRRRLPPTPCIYPICFFPTSPPLPQFRASV